MVLSGTVSNLTVPDPKIQFMVTASDLPSEDVGPSPARRRILQAAFSAFTTNGFAQTSTLDIASQAKVSKRELYTLVGNKKETLVACITARAKRFQLPPDLPKVRDQETLVRALTGFGELLLRERSDASVIAVYRLAIAEAQRVPEIARTIDLKGRETSNSALKEILTQARSSGLLNGSLEEMVEQFSALLWGNLFTNLLLGLADTPNPNQVRRRARSGTAAFLRLYSLSDKPS
jgi:AcrR family transcriptional regulator